MGKQAPHAPSCKGASCEGNTCQVALLTKDLDGINIGTTAPKRKVKNKKGVIVGAKKS